MASKGRNSAYSYYTTTPGGKPVYGGMRRVGANGDLPGQTTGFVTPQMPPREMIAVWAVYWNEFWGTFFFSVVGRLFVAAFGGSVVAGTIPTVFGNAFANAFALFGAMVIFGSASGGHFNPAVTLAVWLIEFATFYIFGRRQLGVFRGMLVTAPEPETKKGEPAVVELPSRQQRQLRWYAVWYPLLYPVFQLAAFFLAALSIWGIMPGGSRSAPIELGIPFKGPITGNNNKIFGAEVLGSFLYITGFVLLMKLFGGQSIMQQTLRALVFSFWYFVLILTFAPWAGAVWNPFLWLAFFAVSGRSRHWWIFFWPAFIAAIGAALFCWIHFWISQIPVMHFSRTIGGRRFEIALDRMPPGHASYGKVPARGPAPGMYSYVP